MHTEFRYLSEADAIDCGALDASSCVDTIEEVFGLLATGDYLMGGPRGNSHGLGLAFPERSRFPGMPLAGPDRRFVAMPGYLGGRFDVCGNKWYGSNAGNRDLGLPRSVLTMTLNDKDTGEPIAFLAANAISSARTGAVTGVAARHLVRQDSAVLAVVGCGPINRSCVSSLISQLPGVNTVVCVDIERRASEQLAAWVTSTFGLTASVVDTAEEAVATADVVTVAASRLAPLEVRHEWFAADAAVLLTGPMRADDAFWTTSTIVYDHVPLHLDYVAEARESGDVRRAYDGLIGGQIYGLIDQGRLPKLEDSLSLGELVLDAGVAADPVPGRVVLVASGMSVLDIGWAFEIYDRARAQGIGRALSLWG